MGLLAKTMLFGCLGLFSMRAVAIRLGGSLYKDFTNTRATVEKLRDTWKEEDLEVRKGDSKEEDSEVKVPMVTQTLLRLLGVSNFRNINIETEEDLEPIFSYILDKLDDNLIKKDDFSRDDISNLISSISIRLGVLIRSLETRIKQGKAIIEHWDKIDRSDKKRKDFKKSLETGDKKNLKVLFELALVLAKDAALEVIKKTPAIKLIEKKVDAERDLIWELEEPKKELIKQKKALEKQGETLSRMRKLLGY